MSKTGCHSGHALRREDIPSWIAVDELGGVWTRHGPRGGPKPWHRAETVNGRGYLTVRIGPRTIAAHRLVYAWFHGEAPAGQLVRHLNADRTDNRPGNLALGYNADNMADAVNAGAFTGDHARGELNIHARLTEHDVRTIRHMHSRGHTQVALAARFGVTQANISSIVRRKTWTHV